MTVNIFPARKDGADDRMDLFYAIVGAILAEAAFICVIGLIVL